MRGGRKPRWVSGQLGTMLPRARRAGVGSKAVWHCPRAGGRAHGGGAGPASRGSPPWCLSPTSSHSYHILSKCFRHQHTASHVTSRKGCCARTRLEQATARWPMAFSHVCDNNTRCPMTQMRPPRPPLPPAPVPDTTTTAHKCRPWILQKPSLGAHSTQPASNIFFTVASGWAVPMFSAQKYGRWCEHGRWGLCKETIHLK